MKTYTKALVVGLALASGAALSSAAPVAENWDNHCAKCHGTDGAGQTKIGKKLKLNNYTNAAVQAAMTDEEIMKAINDGVVVDGKEKMKPFKDELSAAELNEFLAYIRAFKS